MVVLRKPPKEEQHIVLLLLKDPCQRQTRREGRGRPAAGRGEEVVGPVRF